LLDYTEFENLQAHFASSTVVSKHAYTSIIAKHIFVDLVIKQPLLAPEAAALVVFFSRISVVRGGKALQ
jgi:hypothetical protein